MRTIIDVLVARGAVKEYKKHIQYTGMQYTNKQSNHEYFGIVSSQFERYVQTVLWNRNRSQQGKTGLYDMSVFSSQIHPDKYDQVDSHLMSMCRSFRTDIVKYLEKQETHPVGTFKDIGVSVFQFNQCKEKFHE